MSVSEIITALTAALVPLGGGAAFVWNKLETRFREIEKKLSECQLRELADHERRAVQLTVIEILWQRLDTLEPGSSALTRAKRLLDGLKTRNREDQQATPD